MTFLRDIAWNGRCYSEFSMIWLRRDSCLARNNGRGTRITLTRGTKEYPPGYVFGGSRNVVLNRTTFMVPKDRVHFTNAYLCTAFQRVRSLLRTNSDSNTLHAQISFD